MSVLNYAQDCSFTAALNAGLMEVLVKGLLGVAETELPLAYIVLQLIIDRDTYPDATNRLTRSSQTCKNSRKII